MQDIAFRGLDAGDSTYFRDQVVRVRVRFTKRIVVDTAGGAPYLELTIGTATRRARFGASKLSRIDFAYTVQAGDADADGVVVAANALKLNGGTVKAKADGTTDANVSHGRIDGGAARKVDGSQVRPPKVKSVTFGNAPASGDTYGYGERISVAVAFDGLVRVNATAGTPTLALTVGTQVRLALLSVPGGRRRRLDFAYTVQDNDRAAGGVSIAANALALNGGTIKANADRATDARLAHGAVPADSARKIDGGLGRPPRVDRVSFRGPAPEGSTYFRGDTIVVRAGFDAKIAVDTTNGKPQVALTIGTATRQAVLAAFAEENLDFFYVVQAADADSDGIGIAANALALNGGTIRGTDAVARAADVAHSSVEGDAARKVDGNKVRAPAIRNVAFVGSPANGATYHYGAEIRVRIAYSRPVVVDTAGGRPRLALTIGTQVRDALVEAPAGAVTSLDFAYTVQSADLDADGASIAANALALNGGAITAGDAGTAAASLVHGPVGAAAWKVDGRPRIVALELGHDVSPQNGTFRFGESIRIRARFDQEIRKTGTPRVSLVVGADTVQVAAMQAYAFRRCGLEFVYRVPRGARDTDGVSVPKGKVDLNGGTLTAADAVTQAKLDHPEIAPSLDYKVNGAATPRPKGNIVRQNRPASGDTYGRGERILLRAVFHTEVVVTGKPQLTLQVGSQTRLLTTAYATPWGPAFEYLVETDDLDADGVSVPANALSLAPGFTIQSAADTNIAAILTHDSLPGSPQHKVDGSKAETPKVRSIEISPPPASDSVYTRGERFYVNVHFDRDVDVNTQAGKPRLALDIGDSTRYATYSHGYLFKRATQIFWYVVQESDRDADGISIPANALSANGAVITLVGDTVAADLAHPAGPADLTRKADGSRTAAPRVQGRWFHVPNNGETFLRGERIRVAISFDRDVAVDTTAGTPYVTIGVGGTPRRASFVPLRYPARELYFNYVVQAEDRDTVAVALAANALSANGAAITAFGDTSVPALLAHDALPRYYSYKVDGTRVWVPRVKSIGFSRDPASDSTYKRHEEFYVQVRFNRPVAVSGRPRLRLAIGNATRYATYVNSFPGIAMSQFRYVVQAADADADGISIPADAIMANGGTITVLGGTTAADLSHDSLAADPARKVDGSSNGTPRVWHLWLGSVPDNNVYRRGDSIHVVIALDRQVDVDTAGGKPSLAIDVGGTERVAAYAGRSTTKTQLTFRYVVQAGDRDEDGVSVAANKLQANGSVITTPTGTAVAILAHKAMAADPAHKVDGSLAGAAAGNRSPEVALAIAPRIVELAGEPAAADLSQHFRDPDGDELVYSAVSASPGTATAVVAGNVLTVRPRAVGASLVTVTAADPDGATVEHSFAVTVEASRSDRTRIMKRSLAAFGRVVGTDAVEAIGGRLRQEHPGSTDARSHVRLGGRTLSCGPASRAGGCGVEGLARQVSGLLGVRLSPEAGELASALRAATNGGLDADAARGLASAFGRPAPDAGGGAAGKQHDASIGGSRLLGLNPLSGRDLLSDASFRFSPNGGDGSSAGGWTFWGQANAGGFKGRPDDDLALDGTARSGYLGADYRFGQGPLAGLALSHTVSSIGFESGVAGKGTVDVRLTGAHPYVQWSPRAGLSVWGTLGAGRGDAAMSDDAPGRRFETGVGMLMAAAGARHAVAGGLAFKADAFGVRLDAEETGELAAVAADAFRLRLAPEIGGRWAASEQSSVRSRLELGVRWDGGSAETGVGAEAGAEIAYAHEGIGLSVEARGRTLLAHQAAGFEEWGASVSVRLEPRQDDSGLSFLLRPAWGATASGIAALWSGRAGGGAFGRSRGRSAAGAADIEGPSWAAGRLDLETGYAMRLSAGGRVEPFGRWTIAGASSRRLSVGLRLLVADKGDGPTAGFLTVDLFGEQASGGVGPEGARFGVQGEMRFRHD